jgi:hypothetical protein
MLELSPFMAPHADQTCRLLALYGGAVLQTDGMLQTSVTYQRREGVALARMVHVEDVQSRKPYLFVLDEVTGEYTSGELTLWPLVAQPSCLPALSGHLHHPDIERIVNAFLSDVLPSIRPRHAETEHLRRQVLWTAEDPHVWQTYWNCAEHEDRECVRQRRRLHQNIWPARMRLCLK